MAVLARNFEGPFSEFSQFSASTFLEKRVPTEFNKNKKGTYLMIAASFQIPFRDYWSASMARPNSPDTLSKSTSMV